MAGLRVSHTFRAAGILMLSAFLVTLACPCQRSSRPVSAKVKEMLLIQQAEQGDIQAQSEIVRKAQGGDPQAEAALGENYEYGFWVTKDHAEALRWYRKAAEQGDIGAREFLGDMYFNGNGVKRDFPEAARWYGCPKASEAILGRCREISYKDLPQGARDLLRRMQCEVGPGSNYDYGSAVDLDGTGVPAFQFCCYEAPHGPCGAVVIGKVGVEWKNLSAKGDLLGFDSACGGFLVLESKHNGFHDVCLPDQCSGGLPVKDDRCLPTIWQFSHGRYRSVAPGLSGPTR